MTLHTRARPLTNSSTHQRTLLLTFDAFGTLFHPHPSVQYQYARTAHEYGLPRTAVTPDKLKTAFKEVFRAHLKKYPNYGRADVLRGRYGGPRQWWEEVIRGSFGRVLDTSSPPPSLSPSPSTSVTQEESGERQTVLPDGMVEALLNRFSGAEGYVLYDDVEPFFARMRQLRAAKTGQFDRVFLGVISNSDDRVPSVLKALGLRVGDVRADRDLSSMELSGFEERGVRRRHPRESGSSSTDANTHLGSQSDADADADIDLIITSYEAGEEKPNRLIFDVARRQAGLLARERSHTHGSAPVGADDPDEWVCVHVGDDYEKDYLAALDAGWRSYLLPRGQAPERPAETISSLVELGDRLKIGL